MPSLSRLAAAAVIGVGLAIGPAPAAAAEPGRPAGADGPASAGAIVGVVAASDGTPAGGVVVSIAGPGGSAIAVSDAGGRFRFDTLPAGRYLLRAHLAGGGAGRRIVDVAPGAAASVSLAVRRSGRAAPRYLLAGAGHRPARSLATQPWRPGGLAAGRAGFGMPAAVPPPASDEAAPTPDEAAAPAEGAAGEAAPAEGAHRHDPRAWLLRRARRSVLKSRTFGPLAAPPPASGEAADRLASAASADEASASDLLGWLPVSGEVQFLTRATLDGPGPVRVGDRWPGQVATVSVAPDAHQGLGDWAVRGSVDMTAGDAASWAVAGWYAAAPHVDHDLQVAMAYSRQTDPFAAAALVDLPAARIADTGAPAHEVGRVEAIDSWSLSRRLQVGYGATFTRYGYLRSGRLFSPHAALTASPADGTRVRVALSQLMTAPGAEQFLLPLDAAWLPPARTFTSLSGFDDLDAERTRHFEVGIDHELGDAVVVGVRRFEQDVVNQLMMLARPGRHVPSGTLPAPGGHYYLASASDVGSRGWGMTLRGQWTDRLRGEIDYTVSRSAWTALPASDAGRPRPGAPPLGFERAHGVTTRVEAMIPETSTRVMVRCHINTAFAHVLDGAVTPGPDARFDVRVMQGLPFSPIGGSSWELLVAVRSLFHDPAAGTSIHDELLVVDPPRQLVGGLVVHF